jgi:hypothetical protein
MGTADNSVGARHADPAHVKGGVPNFVRGEIRNEPAALIARPELGNTCVVVL